MVSLRNSDSIPKWGKFGAASTAVARSSVVEVLRPVPVENQGLATAGWLQPPAQHALKARKTPQENKSLFRGDVYKTTPSSFQGSGI